jgi:chromosomal replication initiator protein
VPGAFGGRGFRPANAWKTAAFRDIARRRFADTTRNGRFWKDGRVIMDDINIWEQILGRVETKLNQHTFYSWFKGTSLERDEGQSIVVRVANPLVKNWLRRNYAAVLDEAIAEVGRSGSEILFITEPVEPHPVEAPEEEPAGPDTPLAPVTSLGGLNPRYSFDTFVVGPSNQFAEAACRAVAEAPSRSYNPLFIYGGVGLGKTHLMHAIGHYVLSHHPKMRLTYISTERFKNEMMNAVKNNRIYEFRERYRTVDVLLVDDIQFLAGMEGTQTEFFHTFNSLFDAQKQLVISSDRTPREIPTLEERLRSRFEWGLIADIQPPDLETKVAILKKKADAEAIPLPDNVALYIAGKIKSNIRELEGSLIRLIAYASLKGQEITLALAQDVLKHVLDHDEKAVTVEVIQKFIADYYHMRPADLKARNNSKSVALPRQISMYLCKMLTNASLPEIGRSFGGKHHSTVIHSIRKVERLKASAADFNTLLNSFVESLR